MSASITVDPSSLLVGAGIKLLVCGINDLKYAIENKKKIKTTEGVERDVDFVVENNQGDQVGIHTNKDGNVEMIQVNCNSETSKEMVNKMKQAYAKLKVLQEAKKRGYKELKEEKLADGSVRIVVQKWQ
jgi:hypothetical protein